MCRKVVPTIVMILFICCGGKAAIGDDEDMSSCSYVLKERSGTFTSPGYPQQPETQRDFLSCRWELHVKEGMAIQMRFGEFDIQGDRDDCDRGKVMVYEGVGKGKAEMDSYCPGDTADTVIVRNHTATVVFKWPRDFKGRGFLISYIATIPGKNIHKFVPCTRKGEITQSSSDYSVVCPAGCGSIETHTVWGGGCVEDSCVDLPKRTYRDNSNLCRAAVHSGVISDAEGGRVQVTVVEGLNLYFRSKANGIMTNTGSLSDFAFQFPESKICDDIITFNDEQVNASSYYIEKDDNIEKKWAPFRASFDELFYGWSPADPTKEQWLQVDLLKPMKVTGIETKGSKSPNHWTESYHIMYSLNGQLWQEYKRKGKGKKEIFQGNNNSFGRVTNNFVSPNILARYIRVYPVESSSMTLRYALNVQFRGCDADKDNMPFIPPTTTTTTTRRSTTTKLTTTTTIATQADETTAAPMAVMPKKTAGGADGENGNVVIVVDNTSRKPDVSGPNLTGTNVIAIVITLAVIMLFLTLAVLFLIRKHLCAIYRNKNGAMEEMSNGQATFPYPVRYIAQSSSGGGGVDRGSNKGIPTMSSTSSATNGGGGNTRVEYQNKHYRDGNYIHNNSRMPLVFNQQPSTSGQPIPMRHSISQQQQDSTGSFASDDEDHEYQVIPEYDLMMTPSSHQLIIATSSKASTGSSLGPAPPRDPWFHHNQPPPQQQHGWTGDQWTTAPHQQADGGPPFPPNNRVGGGSVNRGQQRAGTFPHNNMVFGVEPPLMQQQPVVPPKMPGATHSFESFTTPRPPTQQQQQQRRSRKSPHPPPSVTSSTTSFHHQGGRSPSSASFGAGGEALVPLIPLLRENSHPGYHGDNHHHPHQHPVYYSAVPNDVDNHHHQQQHLFYPSEQRRHNNTSSYDVPTPQQTFRQPQFHQQPNSYTSMPSTTEQQQHQQSQNSSLGRESDVEFVGNPQHPQHQHSVGGVPQQHPVMLARTESSSHSKQRNGYDHLHRFRNNNIRSTTPPTAPDPTRPPSPQLNTYHQLDLNNRQQTAQITS